MAPFVLVTVTLAAAGTVPPGVYVQLTELELTDSVPTELLVDELLELDVVPFVVVVLDDVL
jgi:hypothetical protein